MQGILTDKMNEIYECTDLDQCKALVQDVVNSSTIRAEDKRKMLITTAQCQSLLKLQTYMTNSWFYFNNMGVK